MGIRWVFVLDGTEDFGSIDVVAALVDDCVTDFSNKNHEP
jgi:hypothetical protein